jgi:hypothetical protein
MEKGVVGSMHECGVTESYKLKRQVILSASEAAEMILRVDDSESLIVFPRPSSLVPMLTHLPVRQFSGLHRGGARATTRLT